MRSAKMRKAMFASRWGLSAPPALHGEYNGTVMCTTSLPSQAWRKSLCTKGFPLSTRTFGGAVYSHMKALSPCATDSALADLSARNTVYRVNRHVRLITHVKPSLSGKGPTKSTPTQPKTPNCLIGWSLAWFLLTAFAFWHLSQLSHTAFTPLLIPRQ